MVAELSCFDYIIPVRNLRACPRRGVARIACGLLVLMIMLPLTKISELVIL